MCEFRLSQAWAKSAKKPFFAKDKHRSVSKLSAGFGRLGEDIGRLGRCFRRNLAQIGKKNNREGLPYTMPFLRRKNSAESPGSSSQLRKRASWILHPSHTTPACKTRPNPDLKPQTLKPTTQTLPSKFQLLHLHTYSNPKPQNLKPQTSNLISNLNSQTSGGGGRHEP